MPWTVALAWLALQGPAPATHVLVVTGVGGDPKYATAFAEQAETLIRNLSGPYGVGWDRIVWLADDPARAPDRIAGRSTRERVTAALAAIAATAGAGDRLLVVLIGHGSDDGTPRFNLPGPDLTADELAGALDRFPGEAVAVVNAASASGGFLERLQAPHRLVITATKSGLERNETRFAAAFGQAFAGGAAADTDKDGRLSLLEAYAFATREVARRYEDDNLLLTEHARLSDEALAGRFRFAPAGTVIIAAPGDSATAGLLRRKADLERRVGALRAGKERMAAPAYERALEELLVELAQVNQTLRQRGVPP